MADPTMTRRSDGLDLTPETQREIWQSARYESAFMQLVPQIQLPGLGVRVPIITGDPEAAWVNEGAVKTKAGVTFGKKDMVPYTLAVILPFSNQFRRDFNALYEQVVAKGPQAIARAFDKTVMGVLDAPGSDFDTLKDAPCISLGSTIWKSLNDADDQISAADGKLDGWALSPALEIGVKHIDRCAMPAVTDRTSEEPPPTSVFSQSPSAAPLSTGRSKRRGSVR